MITVTYTYTCDGCPVVLHSRTSKALPRGWVEHCLSDGREVHMCPACAADWIRYETGKFGVATP